MKKIHLLLVALLCASVAHADEKSGTPIDGSTAPGIAPPTTSPQSPPKTKIEVFLLRKDVPIEQDWSPCPAFDVQDKHEWHLVLEATAVHVKGQKNLKEKGMVFNFYRDGHADDEPTSMRYLDVDEAEALSQGLLTLSNLKGLSPLSFEAGFKSKSNIRISSAFGENGRMETMISAEGIPDTLLADSSSQLLKMKKAVDYLLAWLRTH